MRLVTDDKSLIVTGAHHETHVVMLVLRLVAAGGNHMAIQIENGVLDFQSVKPRFLLGFTQRHTYQVGVTVGVAPQLQPAIQFAVMGEQYSFGIGADQPGRAGEMPRRMTALEHIGIRMQETDKRISSV